MLKTIATIASSFISGFTIAYMMKAFNNNDKITKRQFFVFVIFITLTSLFGIYLLKEIQLILTIIIAVISGKFLFNYSWIKSLVYTVLSYVIIIIADILNGVIFNYILKMNSSEIQSDPMILLLASIIVSVISITLINIKNLSKIKDIATFSIDKLTFNQKILAGFYFVLIIALFILQLMPYSIIPKEYSKVLNTYNLMVFVFYFIATFIFLYINYHLTNEKIEHQQKVKEYEELELYTKIIEELSSDIRIFKHDYKNIMHSIEGYLAENQIGELKEYFYKQVVNEYQKIHSNNIHSLKHINNSAVKGLLTSKINQGLSMGVKMNLEIFEDIFEIPMETLDICKAIGILLDNALEESVKTKDKNVIIGFMDEESAISIMIANSYADKPNIKEIFTNGYSSKGENRGLGLYILKKVIDEKYKNILLNTTVDNELFIQEIIINK